jgi:hypothetical protein
MGNTSQGTKLNNTYHDTQTHYLMEQDLLLLQDQTLQGVVLAWDRGLSLGSTGSRSLLH